MTTFRVRLLPALALFGLATALPTVRAAPARPRAEIRIAAFHAALAYGMPNVAGAHLHLHHTINCLVAPSNPHFDPHVLEPCRGLGNGALADVPAGPAHALLARALALALRAEALHNYPVVHRLAGRVHADLLRALAALTKH
jgi:hypothetical protein